MRSPRPAEQGMQLREPSSEVKSRVPSAAAPPPPAPPAPAATPPDERDTVLRILHWLESGPVSEREKEMTRRAHWRLA